MLLRLLFVGVFMVGSMACASPHSTQKDPTNQMIVEADYDAVEDSRITDSRSAEGHTAEGTVLLHGIFEGVSVHTRLAGARAETALAAQRLEAADFQSTIQCAESGLEELWKDYRPRGVMDSTFLKIQAGLGRIREGHVAEGAAVLRRTFQHRITFYVSRHAEDIVE